MNTSNEEVRQLREEQGLLQAVFEHSQDAILIADDEMRYVDGNPAACALLGVTAEELRALRVPDIVGAGIAVTEMWQDFLTQGHAHGPFTVRRPDGSTREVDFNAVANIQPGRHLSILRDRTEERTLAAQRDEAVRSLELLLERAPVFLFEMSLDGRLMRVEGRGKESARVKPEEVQGKPILDLYGDATFLSTDGALTTGAEVTRRVLDGEAVSKSTEIGGAWYDVHLVPRRDAQGNVDGCLGVATDVTHQRRLEEQLSDIQKMDAIGRLAGGIVHDFNNILGAILALVEMMREDLVPDVQTREDLDQIAASVERGAALARQLLAFGRRQALKLEPLSLNRAVEHLVRMLERILPAAIRVVTDFAEEATWVLADAANIDQVLINLAVNARDAMPEGGTLAFRTRRVALAQPRVLVTSVIPPGEWVMLEVEDDGIGIDPEVLPHIFEPFFTTKPKERGSGLGLSTVYGIIAQTGGHLDVESKTGRGTRFRVYLPPAPEGGAADQRAEGKTQRRARGDEVILIVEDDVALRRALVRVLEQGGYEVLVATSGEEALEIAGAHAGAIPLLVSDVVMPGMNGFELAERLRRDRSELRMLFMSGYAVDEMGSPALRGSRERLLHKPFGPGELLAAVRSALDDGDG